MSSRPTLAAAWLVAPVLLLGACAAQRAARGELLAPERPAHQLLDAVLLACKDLGLAPTAMSDRQIACMSSGSDGVPCACTPETMVLAEVEGGGDGLLLSVTSHSRNARELLASFAGAIQRRLEERDRPPLPGTLHTGAPAPGRRGSPESEGARAAALVSPEAPPLQR